MTTIDLTCGELIAAKAALQYALTGPSPMLLAAISDCNPEDFHSVAKKLGAKAALVENKEAPDTKITIYLANGWDRSFDGSHLVRSDENNISIYKNGDEIAQFSWMAVSYWVRAKCESQEPEAKS